MHHYYAALGLSEGASRDEIKRAYRRLARKYHPDVSKEPDAEEKFILVTEAYDYLTAGNSVLTSTAGFTGSDIFTEEAPSREEMRRQRAREYAKRRHEEELKDLRKFRESWYYLPAKYFRIIFVYGLYTLSVSIVLYSLAVWINSNNSGMAFFFLLMLFVSGYIFGTARSIARTTRKYFD